MCKQIESILQEIFPSSEMASYLAKHMLTWEDIRDAIAYAAVPLKRKRDMFLRLASGKGASYFRRQASGIEWAIREMQAKPGEFFYLKSFRYFDGSNQSKEKGLEPYLTWEHIFERIREFLGYLSADEQRLTWFEVEKWSPDGIGRLKNDCDYTVFGTEICYFSYHTCSCWSCRDFSTYNDLNLPVPFHVGDIVTADCRPFAPVSHIVILEVGDNRDCCCLQALYRNGDGVWDIGAVKHGHVLPNFQLPGISLLYRLAIFRGQLPKEERLLEKVSRYLSGDEGRGTALWNYINHFRDKGRKQRVTEEQILSYLEECRFAYKDIDKVIAQ